MHQQKRERVAALFSPPPLATSSPPAPSAQVASLASTAAEDTIANTTTTSSGAPAPAPASANATANASSPAPAPAPQPRSSGPILFTPSPGCGGENVTIYNGMYADEGGGKQVREREREGEEEERGELGESGRGPPNKKKRRPTPRAGTTPPLSTHQNFLPLFTHRPSPPSPGSWPAGPAAGPPPTRVGPCWPPTRSSRATPTGCWRPTSRCASRPALRRPSRARTPTRAPRAAPARPTMAACRACGARRPGVRGATPCMPRAGRRRRRWLASRPVAGWQACTGRRRPPPLPARATTARWPPCAC